MAAIAPVVALVAVVVFGGGVADAAPKGTVAAFGGSGAEAGEFSGAAGVAVNQDSGDVYAVDVFNERVQQFNADGDFIRAWGGNVASPPADPADPAVHQVCTSACLAGLPGTGEGVFSFAGNRAAGIAVDPDDGSVYVADTGNNRIQKFTPDGAFVAQFGNGGVDPDNPAENGELSGPSGVAVHPTSGDIVVADTSNARIQRFSSSGVYEAQFDPPEIGSPRSVAVDSTGAVYVVEQSGGGPRKFAASGAVIGIEDFTYRNANQIYSIAVDPATDHVFAAQWFSNDVSGNIEGSEVIELDSTGAVADRHRFRPEEVEAYGVAVRSDTGRIYVAQTFENLVFILDDPIQTATVEPTTDITSRTATLNGTINPNGGLPVRYRFEVSANDGQTWTPFPATDAGPLDGSTDVPVTQPATSLEPGRDYLVRLVVTNEFGSRFVSPTDDFETLTEPPDVTTLDATQLRTTGATLAGVVNPNNAATTYHFEWGPTTSYGTSIPVPDASAGAGGSPVTVIQQLDGLLPDTVYHYRLVATNPVGTSEGVDRTFRTRAACSLCDGGDLARGYELVSPADKVGGVGVGHWYGGPDAVGLVGMAAHDGERFAVMGQQGSTIADDGAFAYVNDWVFAERTAAGWTHRPGVTRRAHAPQPTTDITLTGATPDLSLSGWGSAQILKLFPEMAGWDEINGTALLLRRWVDPQWEVFGPTVASYLDQETPGPVAASVGQGPKAFAADGSAIAVSMPETRGLAGPGDPTNFEFDDRDDAASSVYLDEITGTFSDAFPGDDGQRELVNVCRGEGSERTILPSGPCPAALVGRDWRLTHPGGAALTADNSGGSPPAGVISVDGSRVFFMSPDPSLYQALSGLDSAQLFVRQRDTDGQVVTRWLSQSEVEGQNTSLLGRALFEGASRDGDKVFFRTTSPLTEDDRNGGCGAPCMAGTPSGSSWDLYMYDLPDGPDGDPATPDGDPAGGELTRISAGPGGDGDCNVQAGTLRWVSDDASRAYFTCAAPFAGVGSASGSITSAGGTTSTGDASNLYVYDATKPAAQRWAFVARLPRGGSPLNPCATTGTGRGSTLVATPGGDGSNIAIRGVNSCVRGTSDGTLVTFLTDGRLTADDPDATSHDVYGYDAKRNELTRISASRGVADSPYPCAPRREDSPPCHGDNGIGRGAMALEMLGVATRPGPGGDRLAFFESRSRLVAEDVDESHDVYQWREGELSLLSTGVSDPDGAFYVGNDRSGTNVYLATRDQLTWQDRDRVLDVYTVRVGGGIPEPAPGQPCLALADGCRGGGAALVGSQVESVRPGGRNVSPARKRTLSLGRFTAAQRRKAARTGRLRVRVRVSAPGKLSVVARARVGAKRRVVGRGSKRVIKPGVVTVTLRLSGRARGVLARGRPLRLVLRASQRGARSRSMTVRLRRSGK